MKVKLLATFIRPVRQSKEDIKCVAVHEYHAGYLADWSSQEHDLTHAQRRTYPRHRRTDHFEGLGLLKPTTWTR